MCGSGLTLAAAAEAFGSPSAEEPYIAVWILVGSAAAAGWIGLAFHAWTRRSAAGDQRVFGWAFVAMIMLACCEIVKVGGRSGATALAGISPGVQLVAAGIVTANAVGMLAGQVRQRALDDSVGRMLLLRRDRVGELELEQRQRLHDARSAILGVKGASTLLDDRHLVRRCDDAPLAAHGGTGSAQPLLETEQSPRSDLFDVSDALGPPIAAHRLSGRTSTTRCRASSPSDVRGSSRRLQTTCCATPSGTHPERTRVHARLDDGESS